MISDLLRVNILGTPVPKGRPRWGSGDRPYTDRRTRAWENQIAVQASAAAHRKGVAVLTGPLDVSMLFLIRRKASVCNPYPDTNRADLDNLVKSVLDGMQLGNVIADDRQVVDLRASERYALAGNSEGVIVAIRRPTDTPVAQI